VERSPYRPAEHLTCHCQGQLAPPVILLATCRLFLRPSPQLPDMVDVATRPTCPHPGMVTQRDHGPERPSTRGHPGT
ncbi:MAG: hypothetical protein LC799_31500, partial [Actinobacteria bacterium]|nr:hypothetical protein [Actinomycetota bacterium]